MPLKLNGSTSGFVALDAPAAAGSNTLVLPTGNGSNGQVLTTNGSGTLSWSTVTSSKILQVVSGTYGTQTDFTTTTMTDTGLSASIAPSSASSNILVVVNLSGLKLTNQLNSINFQLLRGATVINGGGQYNNFWVNGTTNALAQMILPTKIILYLDSPSTTSSTTYKVQACARSSSTTVTMNLNDGGSVAAGSTIILMEVAA